MAGGADAARVRGPHAGPRLLSASPAQRGAPVPVPHGPPASRVHEARAGPAARGGDVLPAPRGTADPSAPRSLAVTGPSAAGGPRWPRGRGRAMGGVHPLPEPMRFPEELSRTLTQRLRSSGAPRRSLLGNTLHTVFLLVTAFAKGSRGERGAGSGVWGAAAPCPALRAAVPSDATSCPFCGRATAPSVHCRGGRCVAVTGGTARTCALRCTAGLSAD